MLGGRIGGMYFGPVLQILITDPTASKEGFLSPTYVNLSSPWAVFEVRPERFSEGERELPELEEEQEIQAVVSLRGMQIKKVELGEEAPHLILTLEGGKVIFLSGSNEHYESWQAGAGVWKTDGMWMVVAGPQRNIAVWAPEEFAQKWEAG